MIVNEESERMWEEVAMPILTNYYVICLEVLSKTIKVIKTGTPRPIFRPTAY